MQKERGKKGNKKCSQDEGNTSGSNKTPKFSLRKRGLIRRPLIGY